MHSLFQLSEEKRLPAVGTAGLWFQLSAASATVLAFVIALRSIAIPVSPQYAKPSIDFSIPPHAIVWSELRPGYLFMYLNRHAAMLTSIEVKSQDRLIASIAADRVPQFFLADDPAPTPALQRLRATAVMRRAGTAFGFRSVRTRVPSARLAGSFPASILPVISCF